jgi:hypothetical protein
MPAHWTYDSFTPQADLAQGDIIEPTAELREVLDLVHPHFLDPKYVSFMVLSQSCDLVRRQGYRGQPINLCVIRELRAVARTLLDLYCGSGIPGIFREENRGAGRQFLQRVVNQNEQAIGLFYLHPDADAGIATASVAMLRIAIALRTDHYEKLQSGRRGRLRPEFQAKLGWLIGNLYARVGTEDWSEPLARKADQDRLIDQTMNSLLSVEWASSQAVQKAKKGGFVSEGKTSQEIQEALKAFEPPSLDQLLQQSLARILASEDLAIDSQLQKKILKRIPNDSEMSDLLKRMRKR